MKKDAIYDEDNSSYLRTLTNRSLARVRSAKRGILRCYCKLLCAVVSFAAGASLVAAGAEGLVGGNLADSSYYSAESVTEDFSEKGYQEKEDYKVKFVFSEIAGSVMSISGLLVAWLALREMKLSKQELEEEREMLKKLLCAEGEFLSFLRGKNLNSDIFFNLEPAQANKLVDEFIRQKERECEVAEQMETYFQK